MTTRQILATLVGGALLGGCAVDADDDPDVVTSPGSDTTIINRGDPPDVNVTPPPKIDIETGSPGGTVTTTGQ